MWKYNEEKYNDWSEAHAEWMKDNLPTQMVESFQIEQDGLLSVKDKHGFMLFHLLHMATLNKDDDYKYWELAQETWDLSLPMIQAFNTMVMGLAGRAGDDKTLHAIGLANSLMMSMFTQPNSNGNEEE
tara:strand:- start:3010 stop:3393 length:384 start_codon:yes stop_codon:yes gene_type:complete